MLVLSGGYPRQHFCICNKGFRAEELNTLETFHYVTYKWQCLKTWETKLYIAVGTILKFGDVFYDSIEIFMSQMLRVILSLGRNSDTTLQKPSKL